MGFKDLFIEREPEEATLGFVPEMLAPMEEINAQIPDEQTTDFIGDVYEQNNLADFSKSIFKVEKLAETLPAEMPRETKRQTVLSIMNTMELLIDEVLDDGITRAQTIEATQNQVINSLENDIRNSEETIESLKVQIEELQKDISMKRAQEASIKEVSTKEIDRITSLVNFLGEGNEKQ